MPAISWPATGSTAPRRCVAETMRIFSNHFSANTNGFSNWSRWFWNPHEILSKMTTTLQSFVTEKIGTFLLAIGNLQLGPKQMELHFEVMVPNFYSCQKMLRFDIYIYCLCLVLFGKSYIFRDKLWNLSIKFTSFCVQDQLRLKMRIWDHTWTRFDAMNPMTILDLANEVCLNIMFFELSPIISIYVKFQ